MGGCVGGVGVWQGLVLMGEGVMSVLSCGCLLKGGFQEELEMRNVLSLKKYKPFYKKQDDVLHLTENVFQLTKSKHSQILKNTEDIYRKCFTSKQTERWTWL